MNIDKYKVVRDPVYGYRRLDPLPSNDDLAQFYESQYYHLIRRGASSRHR